jgi:hypothetical protein
MLSYWNSCLIRLLIKEQMLIRWDTVNFTTFYSTINQNYQPALLVHDLVHCGYGHQGLQLCRTDTVSDEWAAFMHSTLPRAVWCCRRARRTSVEVLAKLLRAAAQKNYCSQNYLCGQWPVLAGFCSTCNSLQNCSLSRYGSWQRKKASQDEGF